VKHGIEFKNFSPTRRLRELVETGIARLPRHAPKFPEDTVYLRVMVERNDGRPYRASLTLDVPGRTLAAHEERYDAEEAVQEAFAEIERQLEKHKEMLSHSYEYKRPARREELRREQAEALPREERLRELFSKLVEQHLQQLYNFARREISYHVALGDLRPGEVTAEDAVAGAVLRAYREFSQADDGRDIRTWLIRMTSEQIEAEVARSKRSQEQAEPIEEDVPETPPAEEVTTLGDEILDFYQPDEDLNLEDLIPRPFVPTPEAIVESRELQGRVVRALSELPRAWRRALVLFHVDGLPVSEIARMTGQSEPEVEQHLERATAYLRQRLAESGLVPHDRAVEAVIGTVADGQVPPAFRQYLGDQIRGLEPIQAP
jgi:ribosomal subunit interface protein